LLSNSSCTATTRISNASPPEARRSNSRTATAREDTRPERISRSCGRMTRSRSGWSGVEPPPPSSKPRRMRAEPESPRCPHRRVRRRGAPRRRVAVAAEAEAAAAEAAAEAAEAAAEAEEVEEAEEEQGGAVQSSIRSSSRWPPPPPPRHHRRSRQALKPPPPPSIPTKSSRGVSRWGST
jgi:hypothetical protein